MSRKASPLPGASGSPFAVGAALAAGVSPARLRAGDLERSVWGVRAHAPATTVSERCLLFAERMPHAVFSHTTAALLLGIPLPWQLAQDPTVHVSVPPDVSPPHASGVKGHHRALGAGEVVTRGGLRMTSPVCTWLDLGNLLDLADLVAATDFLIHWKHPFATVEELDIALSNRTARRGIRTLHQARKLANDRSESPQESILRVLLRLAGFPEPRVNHVVNTIDGIFVARTDLVLDRERIIIEYQGDWHRKEKGRWRADMTRRSKLESLGWKVMELNADDLRDPLELVTRIRALATI